MYIVQANFKASGSVNKTLYMAYQKKWRSNREANRDKFHFKKNGNHFFKIATDRIAEGIPKNNGEHFGGKILALFGGHFFCGRMTLFF